MKQLKVGEWYSLPVNIGDCSNIELDEIEIGLITRAAFLELPQWITQRSVTNRIKKKGVLDHLAKLFPTHFIVALAELTEDDVWEDGREFNKGSEWTIDANSRAYVWRNQMSDNLPDHVLAVKYKGKTLRDIRSIYWAFDNPTAAEVAAEVVTGVLKSLNTTLYTKKFQDGQFVTALSYTCMFDNATVYGDRGLWTDSDDDNITNSEYKRRMTSLAVQQYLPTIKAVENLLNECGMSKDFDQTFITSLFLFHLKMGIFDKNVVELMKPGSVIMDLAAENGGNCEVTEKDKVVTHNEVTIDGTSNIPATMPVHASELYAKNISALVIYMTKENNLNLDMDDEIISGSTFTHKGTITHEPTRNLLEAS